MVTAWIHYNVVGDKGRILMFVAICMISPRRKDQMDTIMLTCRRYRNVDAFLATNLRALCKSLGDE
jgi:hypothetical protein